MSRKTKQQKIIADLRRQLRETPIPLPEKPIQKAKEASYTLTKELVIPERPTDRFIRTLDTSFLKRDLVRVGSLFGGAILIELVLTYLMTHGYLSALGIS